MLLKLFLYGSLGQLYLEQKSSTRRRMPTCTDYFLGMENHFSGEVDFSGSLW